MALATYSDLVTETGNWLNRSDLTSEIPTFIRLFEARMNRMLYTPEQEVTANITLLTGVATYALPNTVRQLKLVYMADATGVSVSLSPMPLLRLQEDYPTQDLGLPAAYAIEGTNITLAPIPDGINNSVNLTVVGYNSVTPLDGVTNTTNWLLTNHPDAYLYGVLVEAAAYLRDDEHLPLWRAALDDVVNDVMRDGNQRKTPMGPLRTRPAVWE